MGNTGEDRAENLGLLEKHNAEIIVIIKMIIIIIMIISWHNESYTSAVLKLTFSCATHHYLNELRLAKTTWTIMMNI